MNGTYIDEFSLEGGVINRGYVAGGGPMTIMNTKITSANRPVQIEAPRNTGSPGGGDS